jgi:hypothetical protein
VQFADLPRVEKFSEHGLHPFHEPVNALLNLRVIAAQSPSLIR